MDVQDVKGLIDRASYLLKHHSTRQSKTDDLVETADALSTATHGNALELRRSRLYRGEIHVALNDPISAIECFCLIIEDVHPKAKRRALQRTLDLSQDLLTKKFGRQVKNDTYNDRIISLLERVVASSHGDNLAKRIDVYLKLIKRDARGALKAAATAFENDDQAIADLIFAINKVLTRPDHRSLLKQIGGVIDALEPKLRRCAFDFLAAIRVRANGALVSAGELTPLTIDFINDHFKTATHESIYRLLKEKILFLNYYEDCEEIKLLILEQFGKTVLREKPSPKSAKAYLQKSSQTIKFWGDKIFRSAVLLLTRTIIGDDRSPDSCTVLGSIALLESDRSAAEAWFRQSVVPGTFFEHTGATSFFNEVNPDDELALTRVPIDFRDTQKCKQAFVCCSDLGYFERYAETYATSLRKSGSKTRIHFHLSLQAEDAADALVARLLDQVDNVSFSHELTLSSLLRKPAYYACMRFLHAPEFLSTVAHQVFLTDIDVIFRRNPHDIISNPVWNTADAGFRVYDTVRTVRQGTAPHEELIRYPRLVPWMQVNAAFVAVMDTDAGRQIATWMADDLHRHLGKLLRTSATAWWVDQNSLLMTVTRVMQDAQAKMVNIENLGMPYGGFFYEGNQVLGGKHPSFLHL